MKNFFQLPYSLPTMMPQQLDQLLESMYGEAELDGTQLDHLRETVLPYLRYVAVEGRVNPREVKRFINAYTLQTLIRPELDSDRFWHFKPLLSATTGMEYMRGFLRTRHCSSIHCVVISGVKNTANPLLGTFRHVLNH